MNKQNRKDLEKLIDKLDEIKTDIEFMQEDEESKYDNLPEGIQDSEKGDAMQEAIEYLGYAVDSIDEAIDNLQTVVDQ